MATDNRTNEPTEAQVEAAMRACIESADIPTGMRADLVAIDGVAVIRERVDLQNVVEVILSAAVPDAATEQCGCALPGHSGCTRVMVDGEPWFDHLPAERDAALARIAELEVENEALVKLDEVLVGKLAARTEQLRTAEARIAEAAKLHRPRKHWNSDREYVFVCDECTRINRYGIAQWPCPTAVSLGLNEGEHDES